ncbi:MAG: hypothetical protein JXX14_24220 [Deltaproteobacteria bacterium]|nr:hypothetical protein [Deltaproteobacteria bacterium]
MSCLRYFNGALILGLLVCAGCTPEDAIPAGMVAQYQLSNSNAVHSPALLRYEVIWMGKEAYEVTGGGAVATMEKPFAVHFELPSALALRNVRPIDTLSCNYHDLPEPTARRPRVVVFEDLDGNKHFTMDVDRIVAVDGVGFEHYGTVIAIEDIDGFLSQLTPAEHVIYYGWTKDEYTPFVLAGASRYWSNHVYPIFENAYADAALAAEPQPVLTLLTEPVAIMREDLLCFRDVSQSSQNTLLEVWVDSSLDVTRMCDAYDVPCAGFNATVTSADFEGMAAFTDEFYTVCGWVDENIQIIEAHQGFVDCAQCRCEFDYYTTYFVFSAVNASLFAGCDPDTAIWGTSQEEIIPGTLADAAQ